MKPRLNRNLINLIHQNYTNMTKGSKYRRLSMRVPNVWYSARARHGLCLPWLHNFITFFKYLFELIQLLSQRLPLLFVQPNRNNRMTNFQQFSIIGKSARFSTLKMETYIKNELMRFELNYFISSPKPKFWVIPFRSSSSIIEYCFGRFG